MKNSEQLCIWRVNADLYENRHLGISGTLGEMRQYAGQHGYNGGVVLYDPEDKQFHRV